MPAILTDFICPECGLEFQAYCLNGVVKCPNTVFHEYGNSTGEYWQLLETDPNYPLPPDPQYGRKGGFAVGGLNVMQ